MGNLQLPQFRYHPDPIGSGSIVQSNITCRACNQSRGWIYGGPVYADQDLDHALCPWCIADGTAHATLGAQFIDWDAVGGYGKWEKVPDSVVEELCFRTPSFIGWQQERWFTHCNDAAQFLAIAGASELMHFDTAACEAVAAESKLSGEELSDYMKSLDKERGPTAYLFRCGQCGAWGGYSDCP